MVASPLAGVLAGWDIRKLTDGDFASITPFMRRTFLGNHLCRALMLVGSTTAYLFSVQTGLANPTATPGEKSAHDVTIVRDNWGIAHVTGHTDADAVFGMTYAQAEDDFNRIETNYLTSLGRLAEAQPQGPNNIITLNLALVRSLSPKGVLFLCVSLHKRDGIPETSDTSHRNTEGSDPVAVLAWAVALN